MILYNYKKANFKFSSFLFIPETSQKFLLEFFNFTFQNFLNWRKINNFEKEIELEESCEILLQIWVLLLNENLIFSMIPNTKELAFKIFEIYISTRIFLCEKQVEDNEEEKDSIDDEKQYEEQLNESKYFKL